MTSNNFQHLPSVRIRINIGISKDLFFVVDYVAGSIDRKKFVIFRSINKAKKALLYIFLQLKGGRARPRELWAR